jgi:hypothetical protein
MKIRNFVFKKYWSVTGIFKIFYFNFFNAIEAITCSRFLMYLDLSDINLSDKLLISNFEVGKSINLGKSRLNQ